MREIILDTETTGLDPKRGDRIVEIGAVEVWNRLATGRVFHVLINPERDVPIEAYRIHGHSTAFLRDKPVFKTVAEDFLRFIEQDPLVIHNADFDMGFINAELKIAGLASISASRVIDTLAVARRKHPGSAVSLDALCDRYHVDRTRRSNHGALLDATLLVDVYCELMGGRQHSLSLVSTAPEPKKFSPLNAAPRIQNKIAIGQRIDQAEKDSHAEYVGRSTSPLIWNKYLAVAGKNGG